MGDLATRSGDEKPDVWLNLRCLLLPPAAYVFFIYGGGLLISFAILGLWILFVYSVPILGIGALIVAIVERKSRKNRLAALYFFAGQCLVALLICHDLMKSFG